MNAGQILQVGTPRDVYERPANRFVAEFMGHSNFYTGRIAARHPDGTGTLAIGEHALPARLPSQASVGDEVFVALRYEKVEVAPTPAGTGQAGLKGVLEEESYMGPILRRRVNLGAMGTIVSDAANNGRQDELRPGNRVQVRWTMDSLTVLNG